MAMRRARLRTWHDQPRPEKRKQDGGTSDYGDAFVHQQSPWLSSPDQTVQREQERQDAIVEPPSDLPALPLPAMVNPEIWNEEGRPRERHLDRQIRAFRQLGRDERRRLARAA